MRRATLVRVASAGLALMFVAAACGDDSGSSSATTGAATSAAAATTAAGAATTAAGAATTAAGSAAAFTVPTTGCPSDVSTPLADGADIVLGMTVPLTGALAAFGAIPQGMNAVFAKVNESGGIDGHKVTLVAKDDAYDPTKTPPLATELVEKDHVLASVFQVGTPNVAATQKIFEDACTPQLFVATGFPNWGDPAHHPWTIGGIMAYNSEAVMWGEFIAKQKPNAKIAELTFDNDFGKVYSTTMKQVAADKGFTIVDSELHEGTDTSIDNQITKILASNPDVVLGETTGAFCPKLMAGLAAGGYKGITIISYTCASVASFFKPVDPAGNGVYLLLQQKDPSDPQYANDPAVVQYKADIAKYASGADPNNGQILTGYDVGLQVVDTLTRAAGMSGGLTHENVMNAAWSTNFTLPLLLGGSFKVNGTTDAYGIEYAEMGRYDASKGSQVPTGDVFDIEGKSGVFQG
ncbi:MAG TPA: ABC transporter substrate-binding protein [Acidimicrobiales bacterium]|nr:ABC transporter substrate-binding protein [Acidimicrobiales bacterium]